MQENENIYFLVTCAVFSVIAEHYVVSPWHTGLIHFMMSMLVQAKKKLSLKSK